MRSQERVPIAIVVPTEGAGARLDRFLAATLAAMPDPPSRSALQRWIADGRVLVDGVPARPSDKVEEGARVTVEPAPPETTDCAPDASVEVNVLYMDDDVVVVCKQAGLVVHPARGHASGTLVHGLLALGAFRVPLEEIADGTEADGAHTRPGIVHRLDKDTSGVMVVARTPSARQRLKVQFQDHSIDREYVALCHGLVRETRFETLHGRHPKDRLRFTTRVKEGRRAVTHVAPLEVLAGGRVTFVRCRLETGRTHQIRVHLSESGHAILGDPLYGRRSKDPHVGAVEEGLGRQALHARVLGFDHPASSRRLRFEAPLPDDIVRASHALR
jgi:23S rRNA pseudouridine1911/1915/1917 synthase